MCGYIRSGAQAAPLSSGDTGSARTPRRSAPHGGAWCFADHMGPADVTKKHGLDIDPPHAGLQDRSRGSSRRSVHHDSLGNETDSPREQLKPDDRGKGVSHSEEATDSTKGPCTHPTLDRSTRSDARSRAGLQHHGELPGSDGEPWRDGASSVPSRASPVRRHDNRPRGLELVVRGPTVLPLRRDYDTDHRPRRRVVVREELLEPDTSVTF